MTAKAQANNIQPPESAGVVRDPPPSAVTVNKAALSGRGEAEEIRSPICPVHVASDATDGSGHEPTVQATSTDPSHHGVAL